MKAHNIKKIVAYWLALIVLVSVSFKFGISYAKESLANMSYPFTWLNEIDLGGKNHREIEQILSNLVQNHLSEKRNVLFMGRQVSLTPYELGLESPLTDLLGQLKIINNSTGDIFFLQNLLKNHQLLINPIVDEKVLEASLKAHFPEAYSEAKNATFSRNNKKISINEEVLGKFINLEPLVATLKSDLINLKSSSFELSQIVVIPDISRLNLEEKIIDLEKALAKKIVFTHGMISREINFSNRPEWFTLDRKNHSLAIDSDKFNEWFGAEMAASFEREKQEASIIMDEIGKISFDGLAKRGEKVNLEALNKRLNDILLTDQSILELPIDIEQPQISVSQNLKDLGIVDLIGSGYTDFRGSSKTRIYNIHTGLSKFNGTLIAPEAVFSFVETLGPVDDTTGYKKELVIVKNETKKEFGGGLCQVSSTAFRAALFTGLPIVERSPHTYAVSYYARPGGQGLDATIYPGSKDLKFKNDTPAHILLQASDEGTLAFFNIYGTLDDRQVKVKNYRTWNWKAAPAEEVVYTADLAPGVKEVKEQAIKGFEAAWDRIITLDGTETVETIHSRYNPWAKKTLIGIEPEKLTNPVSESGLVFADELPI